MLQNASFPIGFAYRPIYPTSRAAGNGFDSAMPGRAKWRDGLYRLEFSNRTAAVGPSRSGLKSIGFCRCRSGGEHASPASPRPGLSGPNVETGNRRIRPPSTGPDHRRSGRSVYRRSVFGRAVLIGDHRSPVLHFRYARKPRPFVAALVTLAGPFPPKDRHPAGGLNWRFQRSPRSALPAGSVPRLPHIAAPSTPRPSHGAGRSVATRQALCLMRKR